jgi:CRISPR-associated protein Cmr3
MSDAKTTLSIRFEPVDTWFFREARPHDSVGASRLQSQFPPPRGTLAGALRARLGDALGIDWKKHEGSGDDNKQYGYTLSDIVGNGEHTGVFEFGSMQLWRRNEQQENERLYPAPALLLKPKGTDPQADHKSSKLIQLQAGSPIICDLSERDVNGTGKLASVVMPELPQSAAAGAKPLDGQWLTETGLTRFLTDKPVTLDQVVSTDDLFDTEPRLGIARDNQTASVLKGKLYQTEHLRFKADLALSLTLTLPAELAEVLKDSIEQQPIQRFGGEGRMAALSVHHDCPDHRIKPGKTHRGLVLLLQSDVALESSFLPGFKVAFESQENGTSSQYWQGELAGISLRLISAAIPKVVRKGGWDLQKRRPRAMRSLIPAGSCWLVELADASPEALNHAITTLNGITLGDNTLNGQGTLICGLWNDRIDNKEATA